MSLSINYAQRDLTKKLQQSKGSESFKNNGAIQERDKTYNLYTSVLAPHQSPSEGEVPYRRFSWRKENIHPQTEFHIITNKL